MRSFAEQNSAAKRGHYAKWSACPPLAGSEILHNVRDIRSFSGTKWNKNLGEARAEG